MVTGSCRGPRRVVPGRMMTGPAGRGAVTPQLSLSYSSQAGNGLLGVGWSLGGLSTISWCGRTIAQDGYTDGGHFDGQGRRELTGPERHGTQGGQLGLFIAQKDDELGLECECGGDAAAGRDPRTLGSVIGGHHVRAQALAADDGRTAGNPGA